MASPGAGRRRFRSRPLPRPSRHSRPRAALPAASSPVSSAARPGQVPAPSLFSCSFSHRDDRAVGLESALQSVACPTAESHLPGSCLFGSAAVQGSSQVSACAASVSLCSVRITYRYLAADGYTYVANAIPPCPSGWTAAPKFRRPPSFLSYACNGSGACRQSIIRFCTFAAAVVSVSQWRVTVDRSGLDVDSRQRLL